MKTLLKSLAGAVAVAAVMAAAAPALAATVSLTVTQEGGADSVRVTVSGADSGSVDLYFRTQGSSLWNSVTNIGYTSGGYFSQVISLGPSANGATDFYAVVAGQQSPVVRLNYGGCTYNCGSPYGLSLSQTSVSLSVGQSATVSAYSYSGGLYVSSNSNPSVVEASISGSQVSLYGRANGSSTVNVCASGYCAAISVSVGGSGYGNLSLSQSSVYLSSGQSTTVSVSGGSGSYYVSSNSNQGVVTTSLSGSTLYLYGQSGGSSTVTVCSGSGSYGCASLYVSVSGSGYVGGITFSETSVYLSVGQSRQVTVSQAIYPQPSFYVSSNSNQGVVTTSLSGSTLYLYGQSGGSSTVTVCASSSGSPCGSVYVNVSGSSSGSQSVSLGDNYYSPSNITVSSGSTVTWRNNGSNPHTVTADGGIFSSGTLSPGASFSYTFNTPGTYTYRCQFHSGMVGTVTVTGSGYGSVSFSPQNPTVWVGQSTSVTVYGNAPFTVSTSNTNVDVTTSGNTLTLYGRSAGSSTVNVCSSYGGGCGTLYVSVSSSGYWGGSLDLSTYLPQPVVGQSYGYQLQPTGGQSPYTFTVISGSLPSGLSLSTNGYLSGSVYTPQTASFGIYVQDSAGRTVSRYFTLSTSGSTGGVLGASTYRSGQLVSEGGTVYIVYRNQKTPFASRAAFEGLGFRFSNVVSGYTGLPSTGYVVRTAAGSHPWGSWIKQGSTVYFVHQDGLIPVPDYGTFLNNGGEDQFVVAANGYDLSRTVLSNMTYSDWRLR